MAHLYIYVETTMSDGTRLEAEARCIAPSPELASAMVLEAPTAEVDRHALQLARAVHQQLRATLREELYRKLSEGGGDPT